MLFHITQVHSPDLCPRDKGGSNTLYNADLEGIKLIGRYGANAQHTLFYVVEAVRYGFLDISDVSPWISFGVVAAIAAGLFSWSQYLFTSGRKLKP